MRHLGIASAVGPLVPQGVQSAALSPCVDGAGFASRDCYALVPALKARLSPIKVRSLWQAHVVAQFLRQISEQFPSLELMLSDDSGGFVLPLGVRIQNGRFEIDRVLLNRERERVLELSGDPQAAAPFLWAESQALHGELLADVPAHEDPEASAYDRDTTKGWHSDAIPIAKELRPYLKAAMQASTSELVFPGPDGKVFSPNSPLEEVLRRAFGRTGIVQGYTHVCRK